MCHGCGFRRLGLGFKVYGSSCRGAWDLEFMGGFSIPGLRGVEHLGASL